MEPGEFLTRWSVRLAMALYVGALGLWLMAGKRSQWLRSARLAWTIGWATFLVHVICAFAFYHHWSHAAAYAETARRTEELVGISWGGGLYLNYLFTILWTADVVFWWRNLERSRFWPIELTVQVFLAFIAFNATVVFGSGMIRWLGSVATIVLLLLLYRHCSARKVSL